ncbi:TPA: hypothetical protein N0F65_001020 [Lagenidium giganteum]|uniref:Endonuclease/exonuclease/phosphatase domain-containing protein n=1 Tax=Lagenidium giganteum TaxID=4803 RepID=A0AAV2YZB0_9STRA|nr:TPA: hypothetical protein N0F65_001020 [Lagenidium giganteum]
MTDYYAPATRSTQPNPRRRQRRPAPKKKTPPPARLKITPKLTLVTQNTRGLAGTQFDTWLTWWTSSHHRHTDIFILQETHIPTDSAEATARRYATAAGYNPWSNRVQSYWQGSTTSATGVACLINPNGNVTACHPWRQELWTERQLFLLVTVQGETFLLANVYAPNEGAQREDFFAQLGTIPWPHMPIIIGGDFNCTQASRDRSSGFQHDHTSPALRHLMLTMGCKMQSIACLMETVSDSTGRTTPTNTLLQQDSVELLDLIAGSSMLGGIVTKWRCRLPGPACKLTTSKLRC